MTVRRERDADFVAIVTPRGDAGVGIESEHAAQPLAGELVAALAAHAGVAQPERRHIDIADHG